MARLTQAEIAAAAARLEARPAEELLAWALGEFGHRFALVTSFQVEGMVVLDLARRLDPAVRVLSMDTGRLPEETHEVVETVRARFGVWVELVAPDPAAVAAKAAEHGPNLFRRDQALRRDGGPARAGIAKVEPDPANGGIVKLNPLADWTREQVWAYAHANQLPVHPLYEQGYTSIGCAPCPRAVLPGEDERGGRWWWEAGPDKECGLHQTSPSARLDRALAQLRAEVTANGRSRPAAVGG
jgi:phosphoadenosine phosphosulfate reductase